MPILVQLDWSILDQLLYLFGQLVFGHFCRAQFVISEDSFKNLGSVFLLRGDTIVVNFRDLLGSHLVNLALNFAIVMDGSEALRSEFVSQDQTQLNDVELINFAEEADQGNLSSHHHVDLHRTIIALLAVFGILGQMNSATASCENQIANSPVIRHDRQRIHRLDKRSLSRLPRVPFSLDPRQLKLLLRLVVHEVELKACEGAYHV